MKFARPPGGFKISMSRGVASLVRQRCETSPEFGRYWEDIKDRLRFVAHVEGVADSRFEKGCRLWAAAADPERNIPRAKLVYRVLGETVHIRVASFS